MDYYEELGLRQAATLQEISRAYKVLARLLHPDAQANHQVRQMAERQMKRLNEIRATLTNEQTRKEYDAQLAAAAGGILNPASIVSTSLIRAKGSPASVIRSVNRRPGSKPLRPPAEFSSPGLPEWAQPAVRNSFWILLAVVVVGIGAWYAAQDKSEPLDSTRAVSALAAKTAPPDEPRPRSRNRKSIPSNIAREKARQDTGSIDDRLPGAERPPIEPAGQRSPQPHVEMPPFQAPSSETGLPEVLGVTSSPATDGPGPDRPNTPGFAGNWFFVPDRTERLQPGVYPATYVELLLGDERGQLSGRYRARYIIPDQAVSPEVSFQVQGDAPAGTSANFRWISADGAKGEMETALLGPNLMRVSWWTTQLGRHAKIASGTAKLIRQQAP